MCSKARRRIFPYQPVMAILQPMPVSLLPKATPLISAPLLPALTASSSAPQIPYATMHHMKRKQAADEAVVQWQDPIF